MAYKRGQEVFRDPKPFVYYVQPNYRKVVCDWCLKMCENEGILKKCTRCKWVYYCDQSCQKEAWNSHHKSECKYLQKQNMPQLVKELFDGNSHSTQEAYVKLLKTILKLKKNGREEFFQLPNGKKRYLADLVSNTDKLREDTDWYEFCFSTYEQFRIWFGDAIPSFAGCFEILGKWDSNSTALYTMDFDDPTHVATGLYLGYSSLDHSCAPNASWFNVGKEMVVRTTEDVKDFSDLRIAYIWEDGKTHERRKQLKEKYFFDCKCVRCEDPNSDAKFASLKCKSCPGWVHESTKICSSCHQTLKLNDEELTIIEKHKIGTLPKFETTMRIKDIRTTLDKYIRIFHLHHEIFRRPEDLFESRYWQIVYQAPNHDTVLLDLEIKKLKLNHLNEYISQWHSAIGNLNAQVSELYSALKLFDKAEFHLAKAEEIIKVVYGENHPWMQECRKLKMQLLFAHVSLK